MVVAAVVDDCGGGKVDVVAGCSPTAGKGSSSGLVVGATVADSAAVHAVSASAVSSSRGVVRSGIVGL